MVFRLGSGTEGSKGTAVEGRFGGNNDRFLEKRKRSRELGVSGLQSPSLKELETSYSQ
jgi:hypothetical protein